MVTRGVPMGGVRGQYLPSPNKLTYFIDNTRDPGGLDTQPLTKQITNHKAIGGCNGDQWRT